MLADADVLGEEGRKVRDACVKVKIIGKPEDLLRYAREDAINRLKRCFAGVIPYGALLPLYRDLLPDSAEYDDFDDFGCRKKIADTHDIKDIHDALENADEMMFVEKYPKPGTGRYSELKKLIDKRRVNIEMECEEALVNPGAQCKYSWLVAQRLVRNCFAGNFADDRGVICRKNNPKELHSIIDIYDAVREKTMAKDLLRLTEKEGPGSYELKELVEEHISAMEKEYQEAKRSLKRLSEDEAKKRVRECLPEDQDKSKFPVELSGSWDVGINQTYDIFDVYRGVEKLRTYLTSLSMEGVHVHLKEDICEGVCKEYKSTIRKLGRYSQSEAERRVRDCFPGNFADDTDIFPNKDEEIPKTEQSYDIFDIKHSIDYFDEKKLFVKFMDVLQGPESKTRQRLNEEAREEREKIKEEYAKATEKVEVEHGSGFVINYHYVITNKHVIDDADGKEIFISNALIDELSCEVANSDMGKDLALLYCQGLDIKQNQIVPLHLSNEPLLPGMQVFSFGYPMSHTGETALFVNGHVSGFKETYSDYRPPLVVLNLSLNSGNSGGPILCWIANQLKVVGVASQKHFKEILTFEERGKIEKIRKSFQTSDISNISDDDIMFSSICHRDRFNNKSDPCQTPMNLLTLKLYDALETHSQFNLSNALPGHCVIKFIEETISKFEEHKDELVEVVKWSADRNILPSGEHFASDCCIQ